MVFDGTKRRFVFWGGQLVLLVIIAILIWRRLAFNWEELRNVEVEFSIQPLWIIGAALTVWITYGLLIEAWRQVLKGWDQNLGYGPAMRIWCLSNLGRYLPGKVWSLAALAVMANKAGIAGWAAGASALVMQALAIGTGVVVVAIGAPGATSPITLVGAFLVAAGAVGFVVWEPFGERLIRLVRPGSEFRALKGRRVFFAIVVALAHWFAYGLAFWMLAKGLFAVQTVSLMPAVGIFAAGYIVGLIMLPFPGGVGPREAVIVYLLVDTMGLGGATALSIASRILLTATEAGAAATALAINRRKENTVDESK